MINNWCKVEANVAAQLVYWNFTLCEVKSGCSLSCSALQEAVVSWSSTSTC
eukprot:m.163202 g.163202  ORF g.163202 m.163202 type:complete len:51 (-) comp14379_c0_seq1:1533-1685(-)